MTSAKFVDYTKDTKKRPVTWNANLPCPRCNHLTVIGILYLGDHGQHMHTIYRCVFWPSSTDWLTRPTVPCDWSGFTVPGWNESDAEIAERKRNGVRLAP